MSRVRRVAIVTGSRAEWGLLSHVAKALAAREEVALFIVATGSHLEPRFGMTVSEIVGDGFVVARRVPMELSGERARDAVQAMANVMSGMAEALSDIAPDIVVVLGDRYEILAAVAAAAMLGFPIAHIHGGERTEGAIDDSIRHAITKLSHLHFAAARAYGDRIVQLGEDPARVHVVGALGVDAIGQVARLDRAEIEARLGITVGRPLLLVTYHPVTIEGASGGGGVEPLIAALDRIEGATIVITGVNADPAHAGIAARLEELSKRHVARVALRQSLGQRLYLSVMAEADAVVGNSSSGVIEAPILGIPTVNIGDRQAGRLMPRSVICCDAETDAIEAAIRRALSPEFTASARSTTDFGEPGVGERIAGIIATVSLDHLLRKRFYDLPVR